MCDGTILSMQLVTHVFLEFRSLKEVCACSVRAALCWACANVLVALRLRCACAILALLSCCAPAVLLL